MIACGIGTLPRRSATRLATRIPAVHFAAVVLSPTTRIIHPVDGNECAVARLVAATKRDLSSNGTLWIRRWHAIVFATGRALPWGIESSARATQTTSRDESVVPMPTLSLDIPPGIACPCVVLGVFSGRIPERREVSALYCQWFSYLVRADCQFFNMYKMWSTVGNNEMRGVTTFRVSSITARPRSTFLNKAYKLSMYRINIFLKMFAKKGLHFYNLITIFNYCIVTVKLFIVLVL